MMSTSEIIAWLTVCALSIYIYIMWIYKWCMPKEDTYYYKPYNVKLGKVLLVKDLQLGERCFVPAHMLYYHGWQTYVDGDTEACRKSSDTHNVLIAHTNRSFQAMHLAESDFDLECRDALTKNAVPVTLDYGEGAIT